MRILVVEDDLEAQRYLVQGLKESGHVVDEAGDGDTGLNLALSRAYDVAVVDRMLPRGWVPIPTTPLVGGRAHA